MGKRNTRLEKVLESYLEKKLYIHDKEKEDFITILFSLAENKSEIYFRTKGLNRINLLLREDGLLYEIYAARNNKGINRGRRYWTVKKLNDESERSYKKTFVKRKPSPYNYKKSRNGSLKRTFNIDLKEYNQMLQNQNGCCAICGKHFSEFDKSLAVDHNHINGENRGLLCFKCNILLGYAEDDIEILQNSIIYLEQWKK